MVNEEISNIYLINAPAGSGKTTSIKGMIKDHLIENPKDNILCITYTNRAAEELNKDIESNNIFIGTIHSFIYKFIGIYFSKKEIIDLYFEIFGEKIQEKIDNFDENSNFRESNIRYISKYEGLEEKDLNYEFVRSNIKSISYNETQFTSLYYGGLSHDDLVIFARKIFERFSVVSKRLTQRYQVIFIDEYQDSSADVLNIFYNAVVNTETKLYFLGDKMQQIYKNYDGSFENNFIFFNKSIKLETNYRSTPEIIGILNNLYNDENFKQLPSDNSDLKPDYNPKILICDDIEKILEIELNNYPNALTLFIYNQKRFDAIGSGNLYRAINRMKRYSYIQKTSATDIIIDSTTDNSDMLIKILFLLSKIEKHISNNNLGGAYKILYGNPKIFNKEIFSVRNHSDKKKLFEIFECIFTVYNNDNYSIKDVIDTLAQSNLVNEDQIYGIFDDEDYREVLSVRIEEFKSIVNYINLPTASTQHGVKGESHDTVFFIAEDSKNIPIVHMYSFFKLWSTLSLTLDGLESFYFDYKLWIDEVKDYLGVSPNKIDKRINDANKNYLNNKILDLLNHFSDNEIFSNLCANDYSRYLANGTVANAKKCFNENTVYGVISAYRLFYVGCSRSRKNLTIFIDNSKIEQFSKKFISKLESIGFEVLYYDKF